jgi:hypothetical protein
MAAAAVDPIQDILDGNPHMSDFLEIEAQVDDAVEGSLLLLLTRRVLSFTNTIF